MNLKQDILVKFESGEALAALWGLIGGWAATRITNPLGVSGAAEIFLIMTFFMFSYVLMDEFVRRSVK